MSCKATKLPSLTGIPNKQCTDSADLLGGRPLPSTNSMLAARLWLLSWHNRQALLFLHLLSLTMIRLLTPLQLQTTVATKMSLP